MIDLRTLGEAFLNGNSSQKPRTTCSYYHIPFKMMMQQTFEYSEIPNYFQD